jgi:ArsR family transcriptional regulator
MDNRFNRYVQIFKALADETRLEIISMLVGGELCACNILERFNITQPTLSYHMKLLCDSGLVKGRRDGAWMKYTLNEERFFEICGNYKNFCQKIKENMEKENHLSDSVVRR